MFHYVYRISHIVLNLHYYGSRSTYLIPQEDLGFYYFSSSSDKDFIKDQKDNPQNYKYKIVKIFYARSDCIKYEAKIHNKFEVGSNKSFYNRSKQGLSGGDFASTVTCKNTNGKIFVVPADIFYANDELVGFNSGIKQSSESNKKRSLTLKLKDRNRWMNPRAQSDIQLIDMWANAQMLYETWILFNKPGVHKLRRITNSKIVAQIIDSFRNGWIPVEDDKWCTYFEDYKASNTIEAKEYSNTDYVIQQYKNGELISIYDSIVEAARATKADVSACTRGIQKTSKGFQFKKISK